MTQDSILQKYASAYRLAKFIRVVGLVAYVLAILSVFGGLLMAVDISSFDARITAVVSGAGVGVMWALTGLTFQGLAALLSAITDTAVNTTRALYK